MRTIYFVDSKARLKKNNPVLNKEKVRLLPLPFFLEYLILKQLQEIVKKMLSKNMDIEEIIEITGFSKEGIEKIKKG